MSSLHFPDTPRTSRCGNERGQKRNQPHPISILRNTFDLNTGHSNNDDEEQQDEGESLHLMANTMLVNIYVDSVASTNGKAP